MSRALARYVEALHAVQLAELVGTWDEIDAAHDLADCFWDLLSQDEEQAARKYSSTLNRVDDPWDTRQLV